MTDQHLKQAAQTILASFLKQRQSSNDDIAQDVYRTIRDEANLLLERESICNVLDSDPFGMTKPDADDDEDDVKEKTKNADMIGRVKKLLKVVSCTRTATIDGYSHIQAVVELNNDGNMKNVEQNVRLHFTFLREPQHGDDDDSGDIIDGESDQNDESSDDGDENAVTMKRKRSKSFDEDQVKRSKYNNGSKGKQKMEEVDEDSAIDDASNEEGNRGGFKPKTIVTYKVEYSVDYCKLEKLFGMDIYAPGNFPSVEEAIPIMDDASDAEPNMDGNAIGNENHSDNDNDNPSDGRFEEIEMASMNGQSNDDPISCSDSTDRFGVFVDPESILSFLDRLNMNFNEQSVFHFLLSFPFYEHEWDVSGFVLSSVFDEGRVDENEFDGAVCIPCPN